MLRPEQHMPSRQLWDVLCTTKYLNTLEFVRDIHICGCHLQECDVQRTPHAKGAHIVHLAPGALPRTPARMAVPEPSMTEDLLRTRNAVGVASAQTLNIAARAQATLEADRAATAEASARQAAEHRRELEKLERQLQLQREETARIVEEKAAIHHENE